MAVMDNLSEGWSVYGLYDPTTFEVRYVGATSQPLSRRLTEHQSRARNGVHGNAELMEWLRVLELQGWDPEIRLLMDCATKEQAAAEETKAIYFLQQGGAKLLNRFLASPVARANRRKWQPPPSPPRIPDDPRHGLVL